MFYAFTLGNHPTLSRLEIAAVFKVNKINFELQESENDFAIFKTEKEIKPQDLINQLGGTIRIAEVVENDPKHSLPFNQKITEFISQNIQTDNKFSFGISTFGLNIANKDLVEIKKKLKNLNLRPRFIPYKDRQSQLSSVQVTKNNLIEKGLEVVALTGENCNYLGKTLTVQDFESYNKRDYGRPKRNPKAGMLPPKLAQIMINIGRGLVDDKNITLLDPFCGAGTILQEAILMKLKPTGSSRDETQIRAARKNLEWLEKELGIKDSKFKLINSEIENLERYVKPDRINLIVTEPYLGPPQKHELTEKAFESIASELVPLYLKTFENIKKVLKKDGIVVIIFPIFKVKDGQDGSLKILDDLQENGYTLIEPLKRFLNTAEKDLTYSRPDQIVKRQIMVFQLKS